MHVLLFGTTKRVTTCILRAEKDPSECYLGIKIVPAKVFLSKTKTFEKIQEVSFTWLRESKQYMPSYGDTGTHSCVFDVVVWFSSCVIWGCDKLLCLPCEFNLTLWFRQLALAPVIYRKPLSHAPSHTHDRMFTIAYTFFHGRTFLRWGMPFCCMDSWSLPRSARQAPPRWSSKRKSIDWKGEKPHFEDAPVYFLCVSSQL